MSTFLVLKSPCCCFSHQFVSVQFPMISGHHHGGRGAPVASAPMWAPAGASVTRCRFSPQFQLKPLAFDFKT